MNKRIWKLTGEVAKKAACREILVAPEGYVVTLAEPTRSLDQNSLLWPLLTEVSKQVDWYGNKLTADEWKDVFSAALKKQKVVPGLDGGFVLAHHFAAYHLHKVRDLQVVTAVPAIRMVPACLGCVGTFVAADIHITIGGKLGIVEVDLIPDRFGSPLVGVIPGLI